MVKGRGTERKGSKDVSPCCRLGLSRRASITFIGRLLLYEEMGRALYLGMW